MELIYIINLTDVADSTHIVPLPGWSALNSNFNVYNTNITLNKWSGKSLNDLKIKYYGTNISVDINYNAIDPTTGLRISVEVKK